MEYIRNNILFRLRTPCLNHNILWGIDGYLHLYENIHLNVNKCILKQKEDHPLKNAGEEEEEINGMSI